MKRVAPRGLLLSLVLLAPLGCSGSSGTTSSSSSAAPVPKVPAEEAAALHTWFYATKAGGDYAELQYATYGGSDAMAEFPPGARVACDRVKSAIATFRGDLPAPSPTVQAALDQALSKLEHGQLACEAATAPGADPVAARSSRHDASIDFPEGLTAVQVALRDGGIPV